MWLIAYLGYAIKRHKEKKWPRNWNRIQLIPIRRTWHFLLPQKSTDRVNWPLWLRNSGVKLRQLLKVTARYRVLKEKGDEEELQDWPRRLQWYWARQQKQEQDSDLSEEDQEILRDWRQWLTPCEDSADIQVPQFHPRWQGSWDLHGTHLGPTGPRWVPCWPHESCYQGG